MKKLCLKLFERAVLLVAVPILVVSILFAPMVAYGNDTDSAPYRDNYFFESSQRLGQEIQQVEKRSGLFSLELVNPLIELGNLQQAEGLHIEAIDSFHRVQNIVHRNYGVHTARQIDVLDSLMASYAQLGEIRSLDRMQQFRHFIAVKSFTVGSLELNSARMMLADWYRNTGRYANASHLYKSIREASEPSALNDLDLSRAEALTSFLSGKCCASEVLEESALNPDTQLDWVDLSFLEDRSINTGVTSNASPKYLGPASSHDIVQLMGFSQMRKTHSARSEVYVDFGEREPGAPPVKVVGAPVAMCETTYKQLTTSHDKHPELTVTLTVMPDGTPKSIQIEGSSNQKLKRYVRDALKRARFTPGSNERGEFTDKELSFTQRFDEQRVTLSNHTPVHQWSKALTARTCQIQGVQRIAQF